MIFNTSNNFLLFWWLFFVVNFLINKSFFSTLLWFAIQKTSNSYLYNTFCLQFWKHMTILGKLWYWDFSILKNILLLRKNLKKNIIILNYHCGNFQYIPKQKLKYLYKSLVKPLRRLINRISNENIRYSYLSNVKIYENIVKPSVITTIYSVPGIIIFNITIKILSDQIKSSLKKISIANFFF